ncbi:hypothetical protein EKO27_g10609 [Xylaria grammica]|uniref:DUF6604 domain-containing protein n=1 Tax=Xylaria grammica TaxID=363999 RepID=A0A439CQR6_9PEZI|nr:hypothetical protein EKO27_g10609 [Xylaria grammica]
MRPPVLAGSYEQYKQDTEFVRDWLVSTARSLQCPKNLLPTTTPITQPEPGGRRKGKARTQAKKRVTSSTLKFPTKNFILLAAYIATKAVSVPHTFRTRIDHAIALRVTHGINFNDYGHPTNRTSDAGHQHFIEVLKGVREALKPLQSINDTDHSFPNTLDIDAPAEPRDSYDISKPEEWTNFENAFFALTAVVNDSNKMRDRVRWIWSNYRTGRFDLATAAIATDTAIELVGNMMEDALPLLKQCGGIRNMMEKLYVHQCLAKGWDETDLMVVGNAFNYATYDVANGTYFSTYRLLESFTSLATDIIPLAKAAAFVRYNVTSDRSCKTGQEKYENDRALLMQFIPELMTAIRGVRDWPVIDKFMRGIEELRKTKEVPFAAVFAAQIFLDITYELGSDVQQPFHTLIKHISFIDNDIELHFKHHANLKIDTWPACNDDQMRELQRNVRLALLLPIFFQGGETPTTPDECLRTFCSQIGISGVAMSNRRFEKTPLASRAEPRRLVWGSPILSMFKTRYVNNENHAGLTPNEVHQIIERSLFEKEGSEENGTLMMFQIEDPGKLEKTHRLNDRQQRGVAKGPYIRPEQLIKDLVFVLDAETFEFSFPYLHMHRSCWQLLRAVQQSCDALLTQLYNPIYLECESQLPRIVGYILAAASTKITTVDCRLLEKAAEAIDKYIGKEAGGFIVTQVLEQQLGMPVRCGTNDSEDKDKNPAI